jgi:prepilin-type N-terminal cleavage/methylation domain-containing protein
MKAAFTLIEIAIVLVIIGLIAGAIVVGRDLLRAAALKSVISDVNRYVTAVNTFRTKYNNELPGDMADATFFWGASASCINGSGGTLTCNGNADGQICSGANANDGGCFTEALLAWQHLSNSGLVAGGYTGFSWHVGVAPGVNIPQSSGFPNAGFSLFYYGAMPVRTLFFESSGIGHVLMFGAKSPLAPQGNWSDNAAYPVLSTNDAYSIDIKIDDGMPGTGKVFSLPKGSPFGTGNSSVCTTAGSAAALTATYDFTQTGPQCSLFFQTGF